MKELRDVCYQGVEKLSQDYRRKAEEAREQLLSQLTGQETVNLGICDNKLYLIIIANSSKRTELDKIPDYIDSILVGCRFRKPVFIPTHNSYNRGYVMERRR